MWQRKSPKEVRRVDRRLRFRPLYALGFSLFAATVMTLAASQGWWGYLVQPSPTISLGRAFRAFPFFFAFMFLSLYLTQVFRRIPKVPDKSAMICDQCHAVTDYKTDQCCACGGHFELLMRWTWVPHPSDPPDPIPTPPTFRHRYSKSGELVSDTDGGSDKNV